MFDPRDPRNLLYERPTYFKVFISSKMRDGALAAERNAAIETVDDFRPARAWAWERDSVAGSFYSEEECVRQAGTSDALILILEADLTEVTEAEYKAARSSGANVIVLHRQGAEQSAEVSRLVARAREEGISREFSDLDELRSEIDSALWQWFVRGGRMMALQVREHRQQGHDRSLLDQALVGDVKGERKPLAEAVEASRELVAEGKTVEAFEDLYSWASMAADERHYPLARLLLAELGEIVPAAEIDQQMRGSIFNVEGQIASGEGADDAGDYFEQMRQIGVAIDDENLIATAHQNLGIVTSLRGDSEAAAEHYRESFRLKEESGEYYGATQVALNMCNVFLDRGEFDSVRGLLDDLEPYLRGPVTYGLRATLHGQRGRLLTAERRLDAAKAEFQRSLRWARKSESGARQLDALQNLGANATERNKPKEAKRWYEKALAKAGALGDERRMMILRGSIGTALAKAERWQAAAEQFAEAATVAAGIGQLGFEAESWANVAACSLHLGKPERARALIKKALENPHASKSPDWRAGQLRNLGETLEQLGDSPGAIKRLAEAARLAEDPELRDTCLQRAAEIALVDPDLAEQAIDFLDEALALQRQTGTSVDWAWRAAQIGAQLSNSSQAASAPRFFALALRVFARNGDRRRAFDLRNDRAIAFSRIGDIRAALRDERAALTIAEELGNARLRFQAEMNLGELERRRGRFDLSEQHQLRALRLAEVTGDERDQAASLNLLGLLRFRQGQVEGAEGVYRKALEIGKRLGDDAVQHGALGGLGSIAFDRRRYAEAERRYGQAIRKHGDEQTAALAEDLGGLILSRAARGRLAEAETQRLVDLSAAVGWDRSCSEELTSCASLLAGVGGDLEAAVSIQAVAIVCAARGAGIPGGPDDETGLRVLLAAVFAASIWINTRDDPEALKGQLMTQLEESHGIEGQALDFLRTCFAEAENSG